MRAGPELAVGGLFAGWLLFEVAMAVLLADRFEAVDWLALLFKLSYLSLMIRASLGGVRGAALWGACLGPLFSGLVRATGGWLAYTLFTLYLPAIGVAGGLFLRAPPLALANGLALAVAALGFRAKAYPLDALGLLLLGLAGLGYCAYGRRAAGGGAAAVHSRTQAP